MDKATALVALARAGHSDEQIRRYVSLAEQRAGLDYWESIDREVVLLQDMKTFLAADRLTAVESDGTDA